MMPPISLSTDSISFENLLRIRPMGVVSKNDIGDLITPQRSPLWKVVAVFIVPITSEDRLTTEKILYKERQKLENILKNTISNTYT